MTDQHQHCPDPMQRWASERQGFRCASCGTTIVVFGEARSRSHRFGEPAEGHHVIPRKVSELPPENCGVLCRACHINAHEGGQWRDISIYKDLATLNIAGDIARVAALYPHDRT